MLLLHVTKTTVFDAKLLADGFCPVRIRRSRAVECADGLQSAQGFSENAQNDFRYTTAPIDDGIGIEHGLGDT